MNQDTPLFQTGDFTLRSGMKSRWKIECDALSPADWRGLAELAVEYLPPFRTVVGVPRGGVPFAQALLNHATGKASDPLLVAEDVVTTGGSIERFVETLDVNSLVAGYIGVCVFARGNCPLWITPLFQMPQPLPVTTNATQVTS